MKIVSSRDISPISEARRTTETTAAVSRWPSIKHTCTVLRRVRIFKHRL